MPVFDEEYAYLDVKNERQSLRWPFCPTFPYKAIEHGS